MEDLKKYLQVTTNLSDKEINKIIEEINEFYNLSYQEYIKKNHLKLRAEGYKNEEIYEILSEKVKQMRFKAPDLSIRQIRRIIYG